MQLCPGDPWYQTEPGPAGDGSFNSGESAGSDGTTTTGPSDDADPARDPDPLALAVDADTEMCAPATALLGETWLENPPTLVIGLRLA